MNFYIYSRKSVYTGKGDSIDNQIEMCKGYIIAKFGGLDGHDITIYEDEGFSAKNTDRPEFKKMLRNLENVDYIVCYRLDRISRSVSDFSVLIEELNDREIAFVSIKEQFDTSSPMGRAMMYIASVFAQLERETIAERVRDNMLLLARTGRWLGGPAPTGFSSEKLNIKGKLVYKLNLQEEINIVKTMQNKFLQCHSLSGVSKYLISKGFKFSIIGIKTILQNPVYCIADKDARDYFVGRNSDVCFEEKDCSDRYGIMPYNKRDYRKKGAVRNPINKWIIALGRHEGCISGRDWVEIQRILEGNKPSSKRSNAHNDYALLSGLIVCKKCSARMFSRKNSSNKSNYYYICESKTRGGVDLCNCQNLWGREIDDVVCDKLTNYMDTNPKLDFKIGSEKTTLEKEHYQLILDNEEANDISDQEINILSSLKSCFPTLTIREKRNFVRLLVERIEWDGRDVHIFARE